MNTIELTNVGKKFSYKKKGFLINKKNDFDVLKNINLKIKKGECLGVVGPNGAGKTTLLQVMGGILSSDYGKIILNGKILVLIEIGSGFNFELSGRENIYLYGSVIGMSKKEIRENEKEIIEFSELSEFIDEKISKYSNGMKLRLAFSIIVHSNFDILLIDEVLSVGDVYFQRKCINKIYELKSKKRTIVFVSHDFGLVKEICDNSIFIHKGEIKHKGNSEEVIDYYLNYSLSDRFDNCYKKTFSEYIEYKKLEEELNSYNYSKNILRFSKNPEKIKKKLENKKNNTINFIEIFLDETIEMSFAIESKNRDSKKIERELKLINKIWEIYSSLTNPKINIIKKKLSFLKLYLSYDLSIPLIKDVFNQIIEDYFNLIIISKNNQKYLKEFHDFLCNLDPSSIPINLIYSGIKKYEEISKKIKSKTLNKDLREFVSRMTLLIDVQKNYLKLNIQDNIAEQNKENLKKELIYLDEYREKILKDFQKNNVSKVEKKKVEIMNVLTCDEKNQEKKIFSPGDFFKIKIKYHAFEKIINPVFGIAISTDDGKLITGPNTKFHNINIKSIEGKGSISYIIPELPLLEGIYQISITIHPYDSFEPYDYHEKLYKFTVKNQKIKDLGLFHIKSRWKLDE